MAFLPSGRMDRAFFWDGGREIEEQDAGTGLTVTTFVWSPVYIDDLIQYQNSAGTFYTHFDARANLVAVTNQNGQLVESIRYDDFGRAEIRAPDGAPRDQSTCGNEHLFQGRRLDPETGLYFFRARYYDPATGRFISRDPLFDPGNLGNQYTFGGNSPATTRDPSGQIFWFAALAAALTAGGDQYAQWRTGYSTGISLGRSLGESAGLGLVTGASVLATGGMATALAPAGGALAAGGALTAGDIAASVVASVFVGIPAEAANSLILTGRPQVTLRGVAINALFGFAGSMAGPAVARGGRYLRGLSEDVGAFLHGAGIGGHGPLMMIWIPRGIPLPELVKNFRQARQLRTLISEAEVILRRTVNEVSIRAPGMARENRALFGRVVGEEAQGEILALARRLGIRATLEREFELAGNIVKIKRDPTTAKSRIADVFLPEYRLVLELTLEHADDLARMSLHKQGQIPDYYRAGVEPIVITPH